MFCSECGKEINDKAVVCIGCGCNVKYTEPTEVIGQIPLGIIALFFGGIGMHYFFAKRFFGGLFMLLFCWTFIPAIYSGIQGLVILVSASYYKKFVKIS